MLWSTVGIPLVQLVVAVMCVGVLPLATWSVVVSGLVCVMVLQMAMVCLLVCCLVLLLLDHAVDATQIPPAATNHLHFPSHAVLVLVCAKCYHLCCLQLDGNDDLDHKLCVCRQSTIHRQARNHDCRQPGDAVGHFLLSEVILRLALQHHHPNTRW